MRHYVMALLLACAMPASACLPKQAGGEGVEYRVAERANATVVAWLCGSKWTWLASRRVGLGLAWLRGPALTKALREMHAEHQKEIEPMAELWPIAKELIEGSDRKVADGERV